MASAPLLMACGSGVVDLENELLVESGVADSIFLSDMPWTSSRNGWGPVERNFSNGEALEEDGRAISLGGSKYAKGIGTHAPSEVRVVLGKKYKTFQADIGIDDEVAGYAITCHGTTIFRVYADEQAIFDSGVVTRYSAPRSIQLDVTGVRELRLEASDAGDGKDCDHADWGNARLTTRASIGAGLWGEYFSDLDMNQQVFRRLDAALDFDWEGQSPADGVALEKFSVRWAGAIQARESTRHTFYSAVEGAMKVWIDGKLVIDTWSSENVGQIDLIAGIQYPIEIRYFKTGNKAKARLFWSTDAQPREVVPSAQLFER
jgi:hypothetical protein